MFPVMHLFSTESKPNPITTSELLEFMAGLNRMEGLSPLLEDSSEIACCGDEFSSLSRRPPRGMKILKYGTRSIVGTFLMKNGEQVVLKYYIPKSATKRFTYGILGSRALQSWCAAHAFRFVGLPTATPLYFSEHKSACGLQLHMALLATRLATGLLLSDWIVNNRADLERVRRVTRALREAFATMARYQISHGDLKASNIIIDEQAGDAISFIDLDSARILSTSSSWHSLWNKDRERLLANWKHAPEIAAMFEHACPLPAGIAGQQQF